MVRDFLLHLVVLAFAVQSPGATAAAQDAVDSEGTDQARMSIAPLPIIFYTPETKTAIGAAVNVFRRPAGANEETRPSTLTPVFIYTFENQVITQVDGTHYWDDEANKANASVSYVKFPGLFYGVGNDVPNDSDEKFTTESYALSASYLRRVRSHLRVGGQATLGHSKLLEREEAGLLASGTIAGADGGTIVGAGIRLDFDDRNHVTYPTTGGWTTLGFQVFEGALGSYYDFRSMQLESRRYIAAGDSRLFAIRGLVNHVDGAAPFQVLPSLGGDSILRGYFGGRFRDRDLAVLDVEFRQHAWWKLGFVAFYGVGQVAHNPGEFALRGFHAAGGAGFRFRFIEEEKLNVRFDFAWGEDDSGSYISLGEAF
jgi:hypothetical protein